MMKIFKHLNFALVAPLFFLLSACGGGGGGSGGGGTDVQGLEIAEQMALVDANSDSNANLSHALIKWAVPTGGEYTTDVTDIYVYDESMQVLDLVNEILCSFDQTKYADMVNEGAYIAMNDKTLCSRNEDHSQDSSNQSSSESQEFEKWVVEVTRASDTSDEIVKAWIPGGGDNDPFDEIRAKVTITEAKSDTYPFGLFSMDIAGYTTGTTTPTMTGNLSSISNSDGNAEFEFFIDAGAGMQERTHAILSPDGTSGQAYAYRMESFSNMAGDINANEGPPEDVEETVQVAFDENHYLTDFGATAKCLDRNDFNENVWEYNLYDSNGARKSLNAGFGIKVPGASEGHNYGWAGYYGIWFPTEITVTNGLEVTRVDDDATYTVFMGNGRLIKNTKAALTLADFVGDDFQMQDQDSDTQYIVSWNGTTLLKTGEQTCGENGCVITDIAPVAVTLTPNQWINIWKQGLGNLTVPIPESGTISNTTEVVFTTQEYVKPDDAVFASGDLTLYCYDQCVRGGLTQEELNSGDIFFDPRFDPNAEPYIYTINGEDYTLMDPNGDPVIIDDSIDMTQSSNRWSVHSNAMSTVIPDNPWEIWSQTTTYAWETGNNSWNRYSTLLDSNGAAASFDAPLSCAYTDDTYGKFYLDYSGPGQLHGIPFNKIENDESGWEHWIAAFVIPDGSEVTCNGTAYYTKAMSVEQTMQEVDASNCASLTTGTVAAPTNVYTPNGMGAEPTASNVAVIGGVLQ